MTYGLKSDEEMAITDRAKIDRMERNGSATRVSPREGPDHEVSVECVRCG